MAVKYKSMNGIGALKKLGIPDEVIEAAAQAGVNIKLTSSAFEFKKGENGKTFTAPFTLDDLYALNGDKLPETKKMMLKASVLKELNLAVASSEIVNTGVTTTTPTFTEHPIPTPPATSPASGTLGTLPPIKKAKPEPQPWPMFEIAKLKVAPPVKLRDATMMYQPVHGTSAGSRYFLVGGNKDVKVAARLNSNMLSIRIEGQAFTKYATNLEKAGFSKVKPAAGYASLHMDVGTDSVMAAKTLGAVLLGLGIQLETPMPDLKVIAGAA